MSRKTTEPTREEKPVNATDFGEGLPESAPTDDIGTLDSTPEAAETPAEETPKIEVIDRARIFKIGSTTLYESEATAGRSNEEVRHILKASFPEIANATIGVSQDGGQPVVTFLPQPGRKG